VRLAEARPVGEGVVEPRHPPQRAAPWEVEAERARLARLQEELRYLEGLQKKEPVTSPLPGVVTTPHVKERVGAYLNEGDLICVVEEVDVLEVEVALPEQDVDRVRPGQAVELKPRAAPLRTLRTQVDRVAPTAVRPEAPALAAPAVRGEVPGTVTVSCRLEATDPGLRPGVTGYARVSCGPRPAGEVLADRALRFLRTEFWW
jgi:putative peptide zinc metalloprotease protein